MGKNINLPRFPEKNGPELICGRNLPCGKVNADAGSVEKRGIELNNESGDLRRCKNRPPAMKTRRYHASPHRPTFARISNSYAVCRRWPPHHHYSKSQPLSVGIFFARSPRENRNDVASVASAAARFSARFPPFPLSVISRDASARDPTSFIFNDLQTAGSISNLVGRWGINNRMNLLSGRFR